MPRQAADVLRDALEIGEAAIGRAVPFHRPALRAGRTTKQANAAPLGALRRGGGLDQMPVGRKDHHALVGTQVAHLLVAIAAEPERGGQADRPGDPAQASLVDIGGFEQGNLTLAVTSPGEE